MHTYTCVIHIYALPLYFACNDCSSFKLTWYDYVNLPMYQAVADVRPNFEVSPHLRTCENLYAIRPNRLDHYASNHGNRAYCYAELTVTSQFMKRTLISGVTIILISTGKIVVSKIQSTTRCLQTMLYMLQRGFALVNMWMILILGNVWLWMFDTEGCR